MAKKKVINLEPLEKKEEILSYNPQGEESTVWRQYKERKEELKDAKEIVEKKNLEQIFKEADINYLAYEDKDAEPGQSNLKTNRIFTKIWTAVSQLFSGEVRDIFKPTSRKFAKNTLMMKELVRKSWLSSFGNFQFELFVFNMCKYGTGVGRTYHRKIVKEAKFLKSIDDEGKEEFETKEVVEFDEIYFQNLDPRDVWIDENAKPFDMLSINDWMWTRTVSFSQFKEMFPVDKFPNAQFVRPEDIIEVREEDSSEDRNKSVKIFYYENRILDRFIVEANDVMVLADPLPNQKKKLGLVVSPLFLRSSEVVWGVGYFELLKADEALQDKILNMSLDQLDLSIHASGFFEGPEELDNEFFKIKAGQFKRKNVGTKLDLFQQPPPNAQAANWLEIVDRREDDKSGIPRSLSGETTGKTAFEVGTTREEGVKRLKFPLMSLAFGLQTERYLRVDLIKQVYSVPKVERILDVSMIQDFIKENARIENGEVSFDDLRIDKAEDGSVLVNRFREVSLPLMKEKNGELIESKKENFFTIFPELLLWDGDIEISQESLVVDSRSLERNETATMVNLILPLLEQPPEIALKPVTQILLVFDKEPEKWLPAEWIELFEEQFDPEARARRKEKTREGRIIDEITNEQTNNTNPRNREAITQTIEQPNAQQVSEATGTGRGVGNETNPFDLS